MKIIMDGKEVAAEYGQTILEVGRKNGIYIPTLCHVPGLEPAAMCRICTVELTENRRTRLVTSCNYPLRQDAEIQTDTARVRNGRKLIIELLATRCQDRAVLTELGERYGADIHRFPADNKDCIMCGLCARVCERVGANVLTLSGRGVEITVSTFMGKVATNCIGCGACAQICPVNAIRIEDKDGYRCVILKGKEASRIPLRKCTSCDKYFGPVIELSSVLERAGEPGVPAFNASICPSCSRRNHAKRLVQRHFEPYDAAIQALAEEGRRL